MQIIGYVLACRSFIRTLHHLIITIVHICLKILNLYNACQIYFVEWVRFSIFSQLSILQYVGLCVFGLPISLVIIERVYMFCLSIIKSEEWTITHCLGLGCSWYMCVFFVPFGKTVLLYYYANKSLESWILNLGHETMVCAVFYIRMNLWYGWIASWDIRVLVVFAQNLSLCHWRAALLRC